MERQTVQGVFGDFKMRRSALLKALTTDVDKFYKQCDPEKDNLSLYGHPTEQWEVRVPADDVPPEFPEPVLGINFARDGMRQKDWLSLVAVHSDSWLLAVSFYLGAKYGFDKADRKKLFTMINELPTIFEVVNEDLPPPKKQQKAKSAASTDGSNKPKANSKARGSDTQRKASKSKPQAEEEDEEEEDNGEQGDALCAACGENDAEDDFWIGCDICEKWYHGVCVNITPARAQHIKQYKCPTCSNKRARPSYGSL